VVQQRGGRRESREPVRGVEHTFHPRTGDVCTGASAVAGGSLSRICMGMAAVSILTDSGFDFACDAFQTKQSAAAPPLLG
jgi:hypothetical protein